MEKIILITGATDGIGKAAAVELARQGARVIIHGRNPEKAARAQAEITRAAPGAHLGIAAADFAALDQVRAMARDIAGRFERLDVLIHNAGVMMQDRRLTVDGFETTFAVNHLAPFVLTQELLPLLRASRARVVVVASMAHSRGRIDFDNLNGEKRFEGYGAYSNSKLANILFANELAERERGKLTVNSLHPGVITTKLLKTGFGAMASGGSPEQGATTIVYLATSPEVEGVTGKYFSNRREALVSAEARDRETRKRLWEVSEEMTI